MAITKLIPKVAFILAIIWAWRPHLRKHWTDFRLRQYPRITAGKIRSLEGKVRKAKADAIHVRAADALASAFPAQHYHTEYSTIWERPSVSFNLNDATVLTEIAQWLRARGYQVKKVEDSPADHMRTYIYKDVNAPTPAYWGELAVVAHFDQGDDARCKYVQINTKHIAAKTVPVYELQCDGEAIESEPVAVS